MLAGIVVLVGALPRDITAAGTALITHKVATVWQGIVGRIGLPQRDRAADREARRRNGEIEDRCPLGIDTGLAVGAHKITDPVEGGTPP